MAGTWLSVTKGFGGMRVRDGKLVFDPFLPEHWTAYSFRIKFRGRVIKVTVSRDGTDICLESGRSIEISLHDRIMTIGNAGKERH
jgi:maltose phosphorylase